MNLFDTAMSYSTANFTSAMFNNLPAIAFFMAVIFRIEKVNIRKLHSQAKYSWSHSMGKKKDNLHISHQNVRIKHQMMKR
ncbi:unnamed protein product [Malus baccata var. baccata]